MGAGLVSGYIVDTLSANAIATGCKRYILFTTLAPVGGGISIQRVRWHLPCAAPPPWACGTIRHLAGDRWAAGGLGCPCDVRSRDLADVDHDAPYRSSALDPGTHCNFWIIIRHFLCLEFMPKSAATVCGALYCRCVLVYGFDQFCQSRGDHHAGIFRQFCRHLYRPDRDDYWYANYRCWHG